MGQCFCLHAEPHSSNIKVPDEENKEEIENEMIKRKSSEPKAEVLTLKPSPYQEIENKKLEEQIKLEEEDRQMKKPKKKNSNDSKSCSTNLKGKDSRISQQLLVKAEVKNYQKIFFERVKEKTVINFLIVGEKNTGKSVFCIKCCKNRIEKQYIPSIHLEEYNQFQCINSHNYKLNYKVAPGIKDYKIPNPEKYYEEADFILIFFDVTNKGSFEFAKNIYKDELKKYSVKFDDKESNVLSNIILIGNKIDLNERRTVQPEEEEEFCKCFGISFFEISSRTYKNIYNTILSIIKLYEKLAFPEE